MGFSIPGTVGAYAIEALEKIQKQRAEERDLESLLADRTFQQLLQQQRFEEDQRRHREASTRQDRESKVRDAQLTVSVLDSLFDPSSGVPPDLAPEHLATVQNTPFAARLRQQQTLPARATAPELAGTIDATPTPYAFLAPTGAQQQQRQREIVELTKRKSFDTLRNDPRVPEKVRLLMDLEGAGVEAAPIGPHVLQTPDDLKAEEDRDFRNFQRRETFQDSLIRGRSTSAERPPTARQVERDRRAATSQARRDAIAEYNARKNSLTGESDVDLDTLIDEYENDYLQVFDDLLAGEDPAQESAPRGSVSVSPRLPGLTTPQPRGRKTVSGLQRRPAAGTSGSVIRYDAQGNRIP